MSTSKGIEDSLAWTSAILDAAKLARNFELVNLCKKVEGVSDSEIFSESTVKIESSPPKNHAVRFSIGESRLATKKASWGFKPSRKSIFGGGSLESQDYEDVR